MAFGRRHPDAPRIPRKDRSGASAFKVGAIVLAVALAATYFGFTKHVPFTHGFRVKAVFPSANSIRTNSPVRIAGVNVGKVKKIERQDGTDAAVVTMEIDKKGLPIHKDATIKVRPRIFLEGNFFVDLRPGTPTSPVAGSGYTVPLTQTEAPVQLDEVLSSLQLDTRKQLTRFVHGLRVTLDDGGGQVLKRSLAEWGPTFIPVAIASEAVRGQRDDDLSKFIAGSEKTTSALASRDQQLVTLIDGLERTVT